MYRRLKKTLLESPVIHADETVVQVLKEDGKNVSSQSRMWVYSTPGRSQRQVRYFEYQPDRKGMRAAEFLKGFHGCLVTDGYSGYEQVEGVIRYGCWAICAGSGGTPCQWELLYRRLRQRWDTIIATSCLPWRENIPG